MRTIYKTPAGVGCYRVREDGPGTCRRCGAKLVHRRDQDRYFCPRRKRDELWKFRRASQRVRWGEEAIEWLGGKLGVKLTEPQATEVAIKLAAAGRLVVLLTPRRALVAAAKPKDAA